MHSWKPLIAVPLLISSLSSQEDRTVNRLAGETSPYLLQHKTNPVDWYPWGEEALERAKREDRPIFLSIGYSACHWCHVMEHESFENPAIAKLMNEKFINVKVDREERPDIDDIYMAAVVRFTNGQGGWPMSVFLTPDLQPFYGGTYYPPEDQHGRPGFRRVIEHIDRLWRERREDVEKASDQMVEYLRAQLAPAARPGDPKLDFVDAAVAASKERYDSDYGGFGHPPHFAPKFPHASELALLLRHWARTGDAESLEMVETTCTKMARGGMYDQLGGGFHRYSVDRVWLVPHFEKMLYDNAQLASVLAELYQVTGKELYADVLRQTLDYLLREMQDEKGGIYSTQDADSEGEEGKFFVWQKAELEDALDEQDARIASEYWGVTEGGNWEHSNILNVARSLEQVAQKVGVTADVARESLERSRAQLFARRGQRVHPGTDDKILAAWNGLAISAFATAYQVLGEDRYLDAARGAAEFVLTDMRRDGRLLRSWRHGEAKFMAYLEDYAFMADGLLTLFEADFDPRWIEEARSLLADIEEHFRDDRDGAFFFTADDHERLVSRNKSVSESSVPSGQAVAARAFIRAGLLLGDTRLEDLGREVLRANHAILESFPIAAPSLLLSVELAMADPREVVIVGDPGDPAVGAFLKTARAAYPPHRVVTVLHDGNREQLRALSSIFDGKDLVDGAAAAYVCRRGVCERPVTDPAALELR